MKSKPTVQDYEKRLRQFVTKASELSDRRVAKTGLSVSHEIRFEQDQTISRLTQPDEEDFRSFLIDLRQFVMPKERVFVFGVLNLALRLAVDPELKEAFSRVRDELRRTCFGSGAISLVINEKTITGEYAFDLWVNGQYFHTDPQKRSILAELEADPFTRDLLRRNFLSTTVVLANAVANTARLIELALAKGHLDLNLPTSDLT